MAHNPKKPKRRTRETMRPGKPNVGLLSEQRIEAKKRVQRSKAKAELDPKSGRPKR